MFLHRKLADGDIYFVDNREDHAENVEATFRVDGKAPELWDAATGESRSVSYKTIAGLKPTIADLLHNTPAMAAHTTIPLHLDPYETVFVVFRNPASVTEWQQPKAKESVIVGLEEALNRNWTVSFQPGRGAPETAHFDRLNSWNENSSYGVKYFSGTATYSKTVEIPADVFKPGSHLWLDLGDVKDVAEVTVNDKDLGILWKTPFKIDVTGALVPGSNRIVIEVTNLWVNRLIGDQQPWSLKKYTFADFAPYKADSPLLPSGLLGPVRLISLTTR